MTQEQADAIRAMGAELTHVGDAVLQQKDQVATLSGKVSQMRIETNGCLDSLCDTSELLIANLSRLMDHFGVLNTLEGHVVKRPYRHAGRARVDTPAPPSET